MNIFTLVAIISESIAAIATFLAWLIGFSGRTAYDLQDFLSPYYNLDLYDHFIFPAAFCTVLGFIFGVIGIIRDRRALTGNNTDGSWIKQLVFLVFPLLIAFILIGIGIFFGMAMSGYG